MENFKGKMYTLHSGNIAQVGWEFDAENKFGVLRAIFNNGRTYDYWPVTKEKFGEIFKAESKGKWFVQNISGNKSLNYEEVN